MAEAQIAVIGGSGLYEMDGLTDVSEVAVKTPFGDPSDAITLGTLDGKRLAFLPRHGRGHRVSPSEVNARANIFALKLLGVQQIISVSACGSLREHIAPMDLVIPDQIFDRTKTRSSTFFENGIVAHVGLADPFCPSLRTALREAAQRTEVNTHFGGTYTCMEGPQFSTKAESRAYRQWGMDIIGMTAVPEAKLAREAEICYATLAFVTDYDVWHESSQSVTIEMVIANLIRNTATAKRIIRYTIASSRTSDGCSCQAALKNAIVTRLDLVPEQVRRDLGPLLTKYIS